MVDELVTIVVPCKDEEKNIGMLLGEIDMASKIHHPKFDYAVIVVDDGDDATSAIARSMKARVVEGRHMGLGQAILDGINASGSDIVAVMDADLSHNPHALPGLLRPILSGDADTVIGSRYCHVKGIGSGSIEGWTRKRRLISKVACLMARPVTRCKDATSGYFIIRKNAVNTAVLEASSWKIMLEILVKCQPKWVEMPIVFQDRAEGESKFNQKETVRYLRHLWKLWRWKYGIRRFAPIKVWDETHEEKR